MIDSHAHVAFRQFDDDREAVVARAREAGVTGWIEIGTTIEQSRRALALADQYDQVSATIGVHPSDVGPFSDSDGDQSSTVGGPEGLTDHDWRQLDELFDNGNMVAIGEVGFDFYHGWSGYSSRKQHEVQQDVLKQFVARALDRDLPVVWHVRSGDEIDAHDALLDFLTSLSQVPRGVIHTYSGTWQQAKRYLALGLYLSLSGVVTFKNAGEMRVVAERAPLDRLLVETDCPFLAPEPHRGKRNEPAYVRYVAEKVAELRAVSFQEVATATTENGQVLFHG